jgi:alanyl-tRNA synthetase
MEKMDSGRQNVVVWKKDNFWEMGDTGPCGPCTEILSCCRGDDERKIGWERIRNTDNPQVIEIWNNNVHPVQSFKDGDLEPCRQTMLIQRMGFERLAGCFKTKNRLRYRYFYRSH